MNVDHFKASVIKCIQIIMLDKDTLSLVYAFAKNPHAELHKQLTTYYSDFEYMEIVRDFPYSFAAYLFYFRGWNGPYD